MRLSILAASLALALSACAFTPDAEAPAAAPPPEQRPPATTISMPVAPAETAPAVERPIVMQPVPERKPAVTASRSKAATASADAAPARRSKPADNVQPVVPLSAGILKVSMTSNAAPPTARPPLKGPAWLRACKTRQDQGDVIMCDADTLLTQPGDKVLVYTRDARKVGTLPSGGKVVLRESLPSVYRFFVLQ